MRAIGGELELKSLDFNTYFTDSGRSSIRLFLKKYKNKRFLLPDFLCKVIIDVFEEQRVRYKLYKIEEDLSINLKSIDNRDYDVLYIIDYFGTPHKNLKKIANKDKILIVDGVFSFNPVYSYDFKKWFLFNSFRKTTPLADGSIIKTNLSLKESNIRKKDAPFTKSKYDAKSIKYNYLLKNKGEESEYLELFGRGESLIDRQKDIFTISKQSNYHLIEFAKSYSLECKKRELNYKFLKKLFKEYILKRTINDYSYIILYLEDRDELRKYLFSKNIFLPVFWPFFGIRNRLYDKIIAIPLFSKYSEDDYIRIKREIDNFYKGVKKYEI